MICLSHRTHKYLCSQGIGVLWRVALCLSLVLVGLLSPARPARAALTDPVVSWSNFSFGTYTYLGQAITDDESSSDPSNGGTGVQPKAVDIASCSPDGSTPGPAPSVQVAYYDADGSPSTINDAHLAFRMRLADTPIEGGQQRGYTSAHWCVLICIDNDGYKEFVIDLDGTMNSQGPDRFYLLYNNLNTQEVNARSSSQRAASDIPGGDELGIWYAAGPGATGDAATYNHTRVVQDTSALCNGSYEYWLDLQIPLSAFNVSGNQLITPYTPIRFFYSTSTSNTNPLQKDWMMDPNNQGGSNFVVTDPITFGDWYRAVTPTAVTLVAFSATPTASGIEVSWETAQESGTVGFNLLRAREGEQPAQLNAELVPAQGLGLGGHLYTYLDRDVQAGAIYHYWLEEVDVCGNATRYGPATAQLVNRPPTTVGVTPESASSLPGQPMSFVGVFADPDGWADLRFADLLVGDASDPLRAFHVRYNVQEGKLYLRGLDGAWLGGYAPGSAQVLRNPLGALDVRGCAVEAAADALTVRWTLVPSWRMSGQEHRLYLQAEDSQGNGTGWCAHGAWVINRAPSWLIPPQLTGQTLSAGQRYVFDPRYVDPDGKDNLDKMYFLIADRSPEGAVGGAVYLLYDRSENKMYLRDAEDTAWLGGFAPRAPWVLENEWVIVRGLGSSVGAADGKTAIVRWTLEFKAASAGRHGLYMRAVDAVGADTGWKWKGWIRVE